MQPREFLSIVVVSGLEFVSGEVYPFLGDSLLVCESETTLLRRLVLSGPELDRVTADDVVVKDCQFNVAVIPDAIVYCSKEDEIRRLIPQSTGP